MVARGRSASTRHGLTCTGADANTTANTATPVPYLISGDYGGKPRTADIEKVRRAVKRLQPGTIVRMGGMTDCFAPIEKAERVALETIRALNRQGVGYLIVTKSDLVADYIPEMDKDLAHIQISVTSTDDAISKRIEPGAPLPETRIKAVERLFKAGFDVQLRLSPYIPGNVDTGRINAVECDRMLVEFL